MENKIIHYCNIKDQEVYFDGKLLYSEIEPIDFQSFIKNVYKHFEIDYPKFYKMDPLCKLSLISSSILLETKGEKLDPNTAIILSNKSSCIDIDIAHQKSISLGDNSYASPATFVYTLPNIALGEISIKYKLKSENSFFIFDSFNPSFLIDYTNSLTMFGKSKSVLCGWVEIFENKYNAFIFMVKQEEGLDFTKENLLKLI